MKKMQEYIPIETLYEMSEQYTKFSCKPQSRKYKLGTIFDEDKSVKWNKAEVERLNKIHDDEVKELNRRKNELYINLVNAIKMYIIQETNVSEKQAEKIYNYLCNEYHAYSWRECLDHLDDLLDLFI